MQFLQLFVKLEVIRGGRAKNQQPQHSRSSSSPRPAPNSHQGFGYPQSRQESPLKHSQPRRSAAVCQPQSHRTQSMYGRSYKPRGFVPQPRPQARTTRSYPTNTCQRQPSPTSLLTIDSYWSLEGLPPNHEHRHISRSRAENIAKVASWMDKHEGSARGVLIDSHGSSSRKSAGTRSHEPASVMIPNGKLDKHYVAYSNPGSNKKMHRAKYHSYSKALQSPDYRARYQFRHRYSRFFRK
ncbi:hypothetical protein PEBR_35452 [Penicillium brasilianum]|uniref:Uncharacterized protein n=1 Tax=Penicillium brasilianum TaxID=104259 RepID=A0A1S9RDJ8_PENBI|nr:hypothetical protein PEBR_35452 [Penicillium brasilianum]